ncbi:MAG: HU family DNA-binding protein [Dysgonamonadaceae bacterium]|jgi:nucleoid DNA-binding protein|nr:HU family DNA-binding protein [Dysgonamonadaceae bacterium]
MNSTELMTKLSQKLQLPKAETSRRMEHIAGVISSELSENRAVPFGNLGTLEVKKRNERVNVNPASGKRMLVPPKLIVRFKTSGLLKDKLKELKA